MTTASGRRRRVVLAGLVTAYAAGTVIATRQGYAFGRNTIVQCRQGHLFTTVWIPGASVKSVRLGFWRLQWCPAGRHVDLVHPVKPATLTEASRVLAQSRHHVPVPWAMTSRGAPEPPPGPPAISPATWSAAPGSRSAWST